MSQNPLLGNRISLISKKNIRYEGTLYSINESDATVALQDVRSFGTEGREETEGGNFVGPQDTVHPYLLFRGCDIKDLHVHENQEPTTKEEELPADPAILSAEVPEEVKQQQEAKQNQLQQQQKQEVKQSDKPSKTAKESSNKGGGDKPRRPRKQKGPTAAVGTGASLLNRKARGAVDGGLQTPQDDFDFESNLVEFNNKEEEDEEDYDEEDGAAYEKDDFFDSISCDALDKQSGVDNRLRGAAERNLNTETFGAVHSMDNEEDVDTTGGVDVVEVVVAGVVEGEVVDEDPDQDLDREKITDGDEKVLIGKETVNDRHKRLHKKKIALCCS
eukprot:CAMPEP_0195291932 /NCGR_PEP_ID=MMETSP0707-20130614/8512_1 /TAXON_ID=33640 /ORGANISM="Asterionellopsis glacialis, Strain CCMP134" /LENGTH=330 /DNA_ID=CAMNT_0040352293 /DNA_START=167 /DNA_END=1160 /DNA_ORIENTATION=-